MPQQKLTEKIDDYIRAGNTALWVQSYEHEEVQIELTALCKTNQWVLLNWDPVDGLIMLNTGVSVAFTPIQEPYPQESFKTLETISTTRMSAKNTVTTPSTILILRNVHEPLATNPALKQRIIRAAFNGRRTRAFVIVLSPLQKIPPELEKLFTIIEHELPDQTVLKQIAKAVADEDSEEYPSTPAEEKAMLEAATGMSRVEAENAFSLSIIRHGKIQPQEIWEEKSRGLMRDGLLTLHRSDASFADLGGLQHMKSFHKQVLSGKHDHPLARPRGTLLLSAPGCGKSQFAKALGNEIGRPVISLDMGALMGSRVGQSEAQTRAALRTIDAMAPCLLFIDEIEKGLAGLAGTGSNDGGVMHRMFNSILQWLSEHTSDVFTIGTCNDISVILENNPELIRAERFDGMFYIDLPTEEERDKIWDIYLKMFDINEKTNPRPTEDDNWTGAEIRSCCRLSKLLKKPLQETAKLVVPVHRLAGDKIDTLRDWAKNRCFSASYEGLYGEAKRLSPTEVPGAGKRQLGRVKASPRV